MHKVKFTYKKDNYEPTIIKKELNSIEPTDLLIEVLGLFKNVLYNKIEVVNYKFGEYMEVVVQFSYSQFYTVKVEIF